MLGPEPERPPPHDQVTVPVLEAEMATIIVDTIMSPDKAAASNTAQTASVHKQTVSLSANSTDTAYKKQGYWSNQLVLRTRIQDHHRPSQAQNKCFDALDATSVQITQPRALTAQASDKYHQQAQRCVGGLRRCGKLKTQLPKSFEVGSAVRQKLEALLDKEPQILKDALTCIGKENTIGLPAASRDKVCSALHSTLVTHCPQWEATSLPELTTHTKVNTELLSLFRTAYNDPDDQPEVWLRQGAPAGLSLEIADRGVFPLYAPEDDEAEYTPSELQTVDNFSNYSGVEGATDVAQELSLIHI